MRCIQNQQYRQIFTLCHKVTLEAHKLEWRIATAQSSQGNSNKAQEANLHVEMEKQYRFINNNNDNEEHLIKSYAPYCYVYSQQSTVV